jgi:hypothetical protein
MLILQLSDDYGSKYYGPFADLVAAESWVKENIKDGVGGIENEWVYMRGNRQSSARKHIGRVIELREVAEPLLYVNCFTPPGEDESDL